MPSAYFQHERWYFRLLGGFEARCGTQVITRMRTAKTVSLLAYLVAHPPHRFAREKLADLFWGEREPERARNNLSVALNALRHALHTPHTLTPLVLADAHSVGLQPAMFHADMLEFEQLLDLAEQTRDPAVQYQQLVQAVHLYEGDFMAGYYDDWIIEKAADLQMRCLGALEQLVQWELERGEIALAQRWLHRALELEPLDAERLCQLATLYLQQGRAEVAWQLCTAWADRYERVMGVAPPNPVQRLIEKCRRPRERGSGRISGLHVRHPRADKPLLVVPPAVAEGAKDQNIQPPTDKARLHPPPLPVMRTRFFGREAEMEAISALLREPGVACITITGLGGVGKTRLALEIAQRFQTEGTFTPIWVPLLGVSHPHQLLSAIAESMGLPPTRDQLTQLRAVFAQLPNPLLVLDNFEHLLPEGAMVVAELLQAVPTLRCLITSRLSLQLSVEHVYPLLPLTCTESIECPALQLFADRARQVAHDFRLTEGNLPVVQSLCRQLDGIPLALELAAARLNVLSPSQMLAHITERLAWLKSRRHDLPERHREMRGVLDATYALLSPEAQEALRRLSILPGTWSLPLAHALCFADHSLDETARWMQELVEASLIIRWANREGRAEQFEMLEVVREYAQSLLRESERHALQEALCQWVQQTAHARRHEAFQSRLCAWLDFWDEARPLLLEALRLLEQRGEADACIELMHAVERFLRMRPLQSDALARIERLLVTGELTPEAQLQAHLLAVQLLFDTERHPEALEWAQQAFKLCPPEHPLRGWTLYWLVQLAYTLRRMELVEQYWQSLRALYPCAADPELHLATHYLMGYLEPVSDMVAWREEAVRFARQTGDPMLLHRALIAFNEALIFIGDYERALRFLQEDAALCQSLGDSVHLIAALHGKAYCLIQQGCLDEAEQVLQVCEPLLHQVGHPPEMSRLLQAQILRWRGEGQAALDLILPQIAPLEARQRISFAASMLDLAMLIAYQQGDLEAARCYGDDALRLRLREPDPFRERFTRTHYAYVRALLGEPDALGELSECLQFWRERGVRPWQATALAYLAEVYVRQGDIENARAALEEAIWLNRRMGRRLALKACRQLQQQFAL
ncbi:MAG: AAA family ATPase [Armatimonadota bacterium]